MLLPSILAFLAPLVVYCWALAKINQRSRPTLISGFWDCAGTLLAASGILLVVGPVLLHTVFFRELTTLPVIAGTDEAFEQARQQHWIYWGVYFALVFVVAVALLCWRRNKTVIYNVDAERFAPSCTKHFSAWT